MVSQIKLYNEDKVSLGLKNSNLYQILQFEIEEARKKYEQRMRFGIELGAFGADTHKDFFDKAVIEILAGGDKNKLGAAPRSTQNR